MSMSEKTKDKKELKILAEEAENELYQEAQENNYFEKR